MMLSKSIRTDLIRLIAGLVFIPLLNACGQAPAAGASPGASTPDPAVTQSTSVPATFIEYTDGPLWLRLYQPVDEQVIGQPETLILGEAPAGTVVSVNDQFLVVTDERIFQVLIPLIEGPNLIEIIASDTDASEIAFVLTVLYEP
jgi:hypothetical protein